MTVVHEADGAAEQPRVRQQKDVGQHMVDPPAEATEDKHLTARIALYGMEQRQFQVGFVLVAGVTNGLRGHRLGVNARRQRVEVADQHVGAAAEGQKVAQPTVGGKDG